MEENKELVEIKQENNKIVETANAVIISNQEQLGQATEFAKIIKGQGKKVEEYWKPLKDNASKIHKDLCAKEKENLEPLQEAESILKSKITVYVQQQEKAKKEEEFRIKKMQEEEAMKQLEKAEEERKNGNEIEALVLENIAQSIDTLQTNIAPTVEKVQGLSFTTSYKIKIVDDSKVPVSINGMIIRPVDEKILGKLVQASKGSIKIDGIEIEIVKTPVIRS
jgi:hypothetical protein